MTGNHAQSVGTLKETILTLQALAGVLALPLTPFIPTESQKYVPAAALLISIIVVGGMVLLPQWPKPAWLKRDTFEDIQLDVSEAQAAVVIPPGEAAAEVKEQLDRPYNQQGRKFLIFLEAGRNAYGEVWPSIAIPEEIEALVIVDDGRWGKYDLAAKGAPREQVLSDLLDWAISHPNYPVVSVVIGGNNGSLPFGRIAVDRVLPDKGTAWYLMNVLMYRATSVAKYWQSRSMSERNRLWTIVTYGSLVATLLLTVLTWSLSAQFRLRRTHMTTHSELTALSTSVNSFWKADSLERAKDASDVIREYAAELRTWLVRLTDENPQSLL